MPKAKVVEATVYLDFKKELKKLGLLDPVKKIVLAVSGGVDSMVLLHLMQTVPGAERPQIVVAHVNHALREESDSEELFVKKTVEDSALPLYTYRWAENEHPSSGLEEAARDMRYNFFKKVMNQTDADVLMTAHHQDDQVETILMKLTRGSSLEQITGIEKCQAFNHGYLIRPMLSFSKEEIYQYADDHHVKYMEDQTNQELHFSRNRFRNQIIPLLKEENSKFNEHIERFSKDLNDLLAIAEPLIEEQFESLVRKESSKIEFNLQQFYNYSKPMQKALLIKILDYIYHERETGFKTTYIDILEKWLYEAQGNSQLHLTDGIHASKIYDRIVFNKNESVSVTTSPTKDDMFMILDRSNQGIRLSSSERMVLEVLDSKAFQKVESDAADWLIFNADKVRFPLTIRHRQPGDRMTYKGLTGTKKIKDIFIDDKVPLSERDKAWLVEDANGTIVWLISYRKMDLLSDRETDKLTYVLKYKNNLF